MVKKNNPQSKSGWEDPLIKVSCWTFFEQPHQWPLQLENCCCMSLKLIKPKGGLFLKSTSCNRMIMCTFCQHLWSRVASIISTTKFWVAKSSLRCFLIVLSRYLLNFISNDLTWNRWRVIWPVYSKLSYTMIFMVSAADWKDSLFCYAAFADPPGCHPPSTIWCMMS